MPWWRHTCSACTFVSFERHKCLRWQGRHDHLYFINKKPKAWRDCPAQDRKGGGAQSVQSPVSHRSGLRTLTVSPQFVKRALWWPERRHEFYFVLEGAWAKPLLPFLFTDQGSRVRPLHRQLRARFVQINYLPSQSWKLKHVTIQKTDAKGQQRWMRTTQSPNLGVSLSSGRTTSNCR